MPLKHGIAARGYKTLLSTARAKTGTGNAAFNSAVASFEPLFFNNLVVVLDAFFVHRSRTPEGKHGNPMNELRMICTSSAKTVA